MDLYTQMFYILEQMPSGLQAIFTNQVALNGLKETEIPYVFKPVEGELLF